jgi:hypothetical protein
MNRRYARDQKLSPKTREKLREIEPTEPLHVFAFRLFEAGWTVRSIAESFTPKKSRSTVQYWIKKGQESFSDYDFDVPIPDHKTSPDGYKRLTPKSPGISDDVAQELLNLSSVARHYRSGMASTSVQAIANRDFDALISSLVSQNVKVAEIARACQVTHRAISRRLGKYEDKI